MTTGLRSMTGFAEVARQADRLELRVTLRAVNHRFFDLHVHLPEGLEALEPAARRLVRKQVRRGHVDLYVHVEGIEPPAPRVNRRVAEVYLAAAADLQRQFGPADRLDALAALRLPGVIELPSAWATETVKRLGILLEPVLQEALERLDAMRRSEAAELEKEITAAVERIEAALEELGVLTSQVGPAIQQRLRERLAELVGELSVDPARLAQEVALLVVRSDTREELSRLRSHLQQFRSIVREGMEAGRRLDFLCQEMQREINTLLAKLPGLAANSERMHELALAIRHDIERLREQVQNIE
jgi:uncharacterized protein (TIGR00255 family)